MNHLKRNQYTFAVFIDLSKAFVDFSKPSITQYELRNFKCMVLEASILPDSAASLQIKNIIFRSVMIVKQAHRTFFVESHRAQY